MDERLSWGPPRAAAVLLVVVGCGAVALAVVEDPVGRLLFAAVAVLFVLGGGWMLRGPALAADGDGVRVRGVLRTHELSWTDVRAVLADERRRSRAVEIETEDGLLAVPALLLGGISPRRVAQELSALRELAAR